jgi:hypothetical protein
MLKLSAIDFIVSPLACLLRISLTASAFSLGLREFCDCSSGDAHRTFPGSYPRLLSILSIDIPGGLAPM